MFRNTSKLLAIVALCGSPLLAFAHGGHAGHGFADGFAHPFLGLDHLAAMFAVGVLAVMQGGRAWRAPLAFVLLLAAGTLAGQAGLSLPHVEPLVAASVVIFGVLLARPAAHGDSATLAVIGAFAFCHGLAHGSELNAGGAVLAGIVLGSAALHGMGMALAYGLFRRHAAWAARLGQGLALLGGGLVINALV